MGKKPIIVWVSGLAASGKSTFIELAKQLCKQNNVNCSFLSDEQFVFALNQEDEKHTHHTHPYDDNHFLLTTNHHYDEGLRRISKILEKILENETNKIVFIELARGKKIGSFDVTFAQANKIIPKKIIKNSKFVYLYSSLKKRIVRNEKRRETSSLHPPRDFLEKLYKTDDFEKFEKQYKNQITVINNKTSIKDFMTKSEKEILKLINLV